MDNCTSVYHINHVTIECSWTTVSLYTVHDVMNYALAARIDILAVVSGSNMAVYSLYICYHTL